MSIHNIWQNMKPNKDLTPDDQLIKNPFCCKINGYENRFFMTDTRHKVGNTDFTNFYKYKDTYYIDNEVDEKLNYVIGKELIEKKKGENIETNIAKFDYQVPAEKLNDAREKAGKKPIHKEGLPISFLQIKSVEEGVEWYRRNYPKIPNDLLPIIARYNWGDAINKWTMKKERKILRKKKKKAQKDFKVQPGNFIVRFD